MDIVFGFDPNPVKIGWCLIGLAALAYCARNLLRAWRARQYVLDYPDALTPRRLNTAEGYLRLHGILAFGSLAALLVGVAALFSPPPTPQSLNLGFLVAAPGLYLIELGYLAAGIVFTRMQSRAMRMVLEDPMPVVRVHAGPATEPTRPAGPGDPMILSARAKDPTGQLDVQVDVEVKPKE